MNEFVFLASPLAAGLLLGAFFFGALGGRSLVPGITVD
jgi:hypothetical protein